MYITIFGIVLPDLSKSSQHAKDYWIIEVEDLLDRVKIATLIADKWSKIGWYVDLNIINSISNNLITTDETDEIRKKVREYENVEVVKKINKKVKPNDNQLSLW